MALTSKGLEQGLRSQPEVEARSQWWEHQILAPTPVVSGPLVLQKRIPTKTERSEASEIFIRREKSTVHVGRHTGRLRERENHWVTPSWLFESLLWGISSGFPLANHCDLPGSQSTVGRSQDPPACVHASLSQDGFYWKGIWVEHPLTILPFGLQGAFSGYVWSEKSPDFYVVWAGPSLLP